MDRIRVRCLSCRVFARFGRVPLWFTLFLAVHFVSCAPTPAPPAPPAGVTVGPGVTAGPEPHDQAVPRAPRDDDWFEDVTARCGVSIRYATGRAAQKFTILETVGGGLAVADLDRDSNLDLFCPGGGMIASDSAEPTGSPCHLCRGRGDFLFEEVTAQARLDLGLDYSHGTVVGDVNSDGFPDLYVTCYGRSALLVNHGDGTFSDETAAAGLVASTWSTAAAFADVNGDGHLDLFVASYVDWKPDPHEHCAVQPGGTQDVCPPQNYPSLPDHLYSSLGDGTFLDVSVECDIRTDGKGLGVVACDVNHDGYVDLYVANDAGNNHLYLGSTGAELTECGEVAGVALNELGTPEGSMGVDAEDVDGDGWEELLVTNFELEDNSLYRNWGQGQFQHATAAFGLAGSGRQLVGFGTGFCDFDGDGWVDLYVLNGHVWYGHGLQPFRQAALLSQNIGGRQFVDVTASAGPWFSIPHAARGGAVADFDGDGAPDLAVSSLDEPLTILRNRRRPRNWIRLRLSGVDSPRDPVGARVSWHAFGRTCHRSIKSGAGYLSQSDSRLLCSLPAGAIDIDVSVVWPSARRELFTGLKTAVDHVIIEGRGAAEDSAVKPSTGP